MTGLETAIILVSFVITAAAFAFVVLNMGFLTSQKSQSVISQSMTEASSSILVDNDLIAHFSVNQTSQADTNLTKLVFYIKLSQGKEPVDLSPGRLTMTFQNPRTHAEIYSDTHNVTTITEVNGDSDTLLESGERFRVVIDFTDPAVSTLSWDPTLTGAEYYAHPYEEFRVHLRPAAGAVLAIERALPAVYDDIMTLD